MQGTRGIRRRGSALMSAPLTLYLAACHYPAGVLERSRQVRSGDLTAAANAIGPADRAVRRLAMDRQKARDHGITSTLILTGDQIYADATAGLFDPRMRDQPWDRAWDARVDNPWLKLANGLGPRVALLDDHEIDDNWEPSADPYRNAALRETMYRGRSRFIQRMRAGQAHPGALPTDRRLWYASQLNGHSVFVGDTRTEREARSPNKLLQAQLMSPDQLTALKANLLRSKAAKLGARPIIVTPSMLLPRPLGLAGNAPMEAALRCDSWCGYPGTLHEVLAHIADEAIHGCLFLSGDEHLPCHAVIEVQCLTPTAGPVIRIDSVHAGALYAPYPFANGRPAAFIEHDQFNFSFTNRVTAQNPGPHTRRDYQCKVRTTFPAVHHEGHVKIELSTAPTAGTLTFCDARDARRDRVFPLP